MYYILYLSYIKFFNLKSKIIGLCEYIRVSRRRNVIRAKMPNVGAAIWRTILNIKLLCFPRCVPYQNLLNFTYAFKCYHQNVSWPHFSWPTLYTHIVN